MTVKRGMAGERGCDINMDIILDVHADKLLSSERNSMMYVCQLEEAKCYRIA